MPRRAPTLLLAAALSLCCSALCGVASAGAALSFVPCAGASAAGFSCTTVPVPLSRTGLAAGTLSLSLERKQASATQSKTAVIALAGGPGQAALPLGEFIAKALAPALEHARPAGLRPARHRRLGPARLRRAEQLQRQQREPGLRTLRA